MTTTLQQRQAVVCPKCGSGRIQFSSLHVTRGSLATEYPMRRSEDGTIPEPAERIDFEADDQAPTASLWFSCLDCPGNEFRYRFVPDGTNVQIEVDGAVMLASMAPIAQSDNHCDQLPPEHFDQFLRQYLSARAGIDELLFGAAKNAVAFQVLRQGFEDFAQYLISLDRIKQANSEFASWWERTLGTEKKGEGALNGG